MDALFYDMTEFQSKSIRHISLLAKKTLDHRLPSRYNPLVFAYGFIALATRGQLFGHENWFSRLVIRLLYRIVLCSDN